MARAWGRKDDFTNRPMRCIVCTEPIPATRKKDAVCCSPTCSGIRKAWQRSRMDQTKCRYCLRPSTPAERAAFNRWRKWEAAQASAAPADTPNELPQPEGDTSEVGNVPNTEESGA